MLGCESQSYKGPHTTLSLPRLKGQKARPEDRAELSAENGKGVFVDQRYLLPPHVRAVISDDGGVLLDLKRGRCLSLNSVGGQVWNALAEHSDGLTVDGLVDALLPIYDGVERDILLRDMRKFLPELESKGVISNGNDIHSFNPSSKITLPRIEQVISASAGVSDSSDRPEKEQDASGDNGTLFYSLLAMAALVGFDLTLKVFGFPRLYRIVKSWPTRRLISLKQASTSRICASVDRACRYYLKHALCLQRSAVATCILRLAGVPAEMVIGCRKMPFKGHAWVEVGDLVVNDNPKVQTFYSVLERC